MTAKIDKAPGPDPEASSERKKEKQEGFSSSETAAELIGRADAEVAGLKTAGLPAAEKIASQFGATVDPDTTAELGLVAAEAEVAKADLERDVSAAVIPEAAEPHVARKADFSGQAAALDALVAKYAGPDGALDRDAFEKAPVEEHEKLQQAWKSLEDAVAFDPVGFLASAEALKSLRIAELRKELVEKAAKEVAANDPEQAFVAYQKAVEQGMVGEEAGEGSLRSKRREFAAHYMRSEIGRIKERVDEDPVDAANSLVRLRARSAEAGVGIDWEESQAAEKVRQAFDKAVAAGEDGSAFYRRLVDSAPGGSQVAWALVDDALEKAPGDWDEKKRTVMIVLGDKAPEALLKHANGRYTSQSWTAEERLELIQRVIGLPEGKRSGLAEVSPRDLPKDMGPDARRALFDAYLAHASEKIFDNAETFSEEIASIPEKQQAAMVDSAIKRDPYAVVRQAEAWRGALSEGQMKELVVSMADKQNLDIGKDSFLLKKIPDILACFTPEVVSAVIDKQPRAALELAAEGKIAIGAGQKKELVLNLARRHALYDETLEGLEKTGAITPEAVDAVIYEMPDQALRLVAQGKIEASDDQARGVMARRLEIGAVDPEEFAYLEQLAVERGLKFTEDDVWKLLDSGMAGNSIGDAKALGFLKRLASSAEAGPRLTKLVNAAERITSSPSASLRRLSRELLGQLRAAEDPEAAFEEVEGIFERNQLPLAGKVYKVFEVLHPKDRLARSATLEHGSPTLRAESHRGRMFTIYKDLLRAHLDSDNPSLRGYLETFREGQELADKVDAAGLGSLSADERPRFESFVEKLKRLHETSMRGRSETAVEDTEVDEAAVVYERVRESLGLKKGQSLNKRVAEMYLKPIGLESIEQALARMDAVKAAADIRNRGLAEAGGGRLALSSGDMLKGFDDRYLRDILENGSVAKEFLGAGAGSDSTPLDTDLAMVLPDDAAAGFAGALKESPASGYGDMLMLVRDRGQFQETSAEDDPSALAREALKREPRLELFRTGVLGERHYGVRTGLPSTEIDALVATERLMADARQFDSRVMDIVANGQYIPVTDTEGRVILTPEKFDEYRSRFFAGLEGEPFSLKEAALEDAPAHVEAVREIIEAKRRERAALEGMNAELRRAVIEELAAQGIETSAGFDEMLASAEIYDTGSSSRGTNVPDSYDFDYIVKLNAADMAKVPQVNAAIAGKLGGKLHEGHRREQLRVLGAAFGERTADVDIGFVDKSEGAQYESHDAVRDRLGTIRRDLGEEAHERVIASIVLAKKLLKDAGAYKKFEHGGMGGIGVENWVLLEGGSAVTAFESFESSAFDGDVLRPLDEFKKDYKILDPGINAKTGGHDNFVGLLTEAGYRKMAETVRAYLKMIRESGKT